MPDLEHGSTVVARPPNRREHSRTPAYVGSHPGVVLLDLGAHPLPASVARGDRPAAVERLYTVEFGAADLFGVGTHRVHVDLYRSALEPADGR
jgi:hypothetical protein